MKIIKLYSGYGDDMGGLFSSVNSYGNLYLLAQQFQKRYYDYERMYSKEEREQCTIVHNKMRRMDVPENRIQFLEYKMRHNHAHFLALYSDFHKRGLKHGPMIECPATEFPIMEHPSPNMKRDLYIYETEILKEYNNEIVVSNKKYNLLKDMDASMSTLPPLYANASLEFVILTLSILASRLEYTLRFEYNDDNTIKRVFFTNYGNSLM